MHHFIYPSKDATIYQSIPTYNTGLDEIIEVAKTYYGGTNTELARTLMKYDLTSISESLADGTISNPTYYLNLSVCEAHQIPFDYTLYAFAVSQSWEMGVGTRFDQITQEGVSWKYIDGSNSSTPWVYISGSGDASFQPGTTGSLDGEGGTWYTGSEYTATQSFQYETGDVRMDVTSIVNEWVVSESIPNEGFILKHDESVELDNNDYGILKFFSLETNTIFPPKLEIAWDDSSWSTGSLEELVGTDVSFYFRNLKREYVDGERVRFRVGARDRYPQKTFSTQSQYLTQKHAPSGSLTYSIRDAQSENVIIPFSDFTKVSCDSNGHYFDLWTSGLQPERFYKIILKLDVSGSVKYFDNESVFKLVR